MQQHQHSNKQEHKPGNRSPQDKSRFVVQSKGKSKGRPYGKGQGKRQNKGIMPVKGRGEPNG